jgi:hypothetical protein
MATRFQRRQQLIGELLRRVAERELSFSHNPLSSADCLRLFDLLPGQNHDSIIHGSLRQVPTSTSAEYSALSYPWGPQGAASNIIWIDGVECFVRNNLWHALVALRSPTSVKTLWVDALCIDQKNVVERNSQAQMMDLIYRKAQRVRVWLGPSANDSDLAFDFMHQVHEGAQLSSLEKNPAFNAKAERAVAALLKRDYWCRAWTVQEFVLGHDIFLHCGGQAMSWNVFDRSCRILQSRLPKNTSPAIQLIEHRWYQALTSKRHTKSLESLLKNYSENTRLTDAAENQSLRPCSQVQG